jgi:regulator of ribonuclease activity A
MTTKTADLYDQYGEQLQVVEPMFRSYGGKPAFAGRVATVKVHEDNKLVRSELEKDGSGQVLVIDGGGSLRSALVGGNIAKLASDNRWAGIIVYGCIRDAVEVAGTPIGMLALATCPVKPKKNGFGEVGIVVRFGGVTFKPGGYVYADEDGVVVGPNKLD